MKVPCRQIKVPYKWMQIGMSAQPLHLSISLNKSEAWLQKATKCSKLCLYFTIVGGKRKKRKVDYKENESNGNKESSMIPDQPNKEPSNINGNKETNIITEQTIKESNDKEAAIDQTIKESDDKKAAIDQTIKESNGKEAAIDQTIKESNGKEAAIDQTIKESNNKEVEINSDQTITESNEPVETIATNSKEATLDDVFVESKKLEKKEKAKQARMAYQTNFKVRHKSI